MTTIVDTLAIDITASTTALQRELSRTESALSRLTERFGQLSGSVEDSSNQSMRSLSRTQIAASELSQVLDSLGIKQRDVFASLID